MVLLGNRKTVLPIQRIPCLLLCLPLPNTISQQTLAIFFNIIHGRNDGAQCAPMILEVHSSLGGVRNTRIRAINLRHLHKSPVKSPGMLDHVSLQKTDPAAINPVGHPIAGDGGLLLPINQNLLLPETEQSILRNHRPAHIVLLTRAATISPLNPHNLDCDA